MHAPFTYIQCIKKRKSSFSKKTLYWKNQTILEIDKSAKLKYAKYSETIRIALYFIVSDILIPGKLP